MAKKLKTKNAFAYYLGQRRSFYAFLTKRNVEDHHQCKA